MANEILHSTLETDLRAAALISMRVSALLTDQASIRQTGAIVFAGDVAGTGSDTMTRRQVGLGSDNFSSATEIEDVAQTALTDASFNLAVGRGALVRKISDLATLTGTGSDDVGPEMLAQDMAASFEGYFNGLVATAIATASTDAGTSTVDASMDDAYDAIYVLELADAPGPYYGMIHARQLADLQNSARGESGPGQFAMATQDMLNIKGQGYAGSWLGVDWFRSSDVSSNGGNRHGGVWGLGALEYAIGTPKPILTGNRVMVPAGTPIVVEFDRAATAATTHIVGHSYCAVAVAEQGRLVGFVTDA